jgi:hypothetical protein
LFRPRSHLRVFIIQECEGLRIEPVARLLRPEFQRLEPNCGVWRLLHLGEPPLSGFSLRLVGVGTLVGWWWVRWGVGGLDAGILRGAGAA